MEHSMRYGSYNGRGGTSPSQCQFLCENMDQASQQDNRQALLTTRVAQHDQKRTYVVFSWVLLPILFLSDEPLRY
jgi:hypothetical protein